jgi:hypothetical protein
VVDVAIQPTVAYNRSGLYQTLDEVARLLGELMYVDQAVQYVDERDTAVHGPLSGGAPGVTAYQIPIGITYPFVRELRLPADYSSDENQFEIIMGRISDILWDAGKWAEAILESLTTRIAPITHPPAAMYEHSVVRPIETAVSILQDNVVNDFGGLRQSLSDWEGDAADNFATEFYHPFEDTQVAHERLFGALTGGLVTSKAITEVTQHSLMNALHYVRDELKEQLQLRSQQAAGESSRTILIVGSAALSVMSAALGSTSLWPVAVEAAAGALSVAADSIPGEAADVHELAGRTAEQLFGELADVLTAIERNATTQYVGLAERLDDVLVRVERLRKGGDDEDGRLVPIQPDLVDDADSGTFRHHSSGR